MPQRLAQHTVEAPAPPEAAWGLWTNPALWNRFYPGLASAAPGGALKAGTTLVLRGIEGGPGQSFMVVAIEAGTAFTLRRHLLFADLEVLHRVDPSPLGCRLHLRAQLSGPLAWVHRLRLRADWQRAAPELLRTLARLAQQR